MRTLIIFAGAGLLSAGAGALGGTAVDPAAYPWILWTWAGAIVMAACWALSESFR